MSAACLDAEIVALVGRHDIQSPRKWPDKPVSLSTILMSYPCDSEVAGSAMLRTYYGGEGEHRVTDYWEIDQVIHTPDFGGQWLRMTEDGPVRVWPR